MLRAIIIITDVLIDQHLAACLATMWSVALDVCYTFPSVLISSGGVWHMITPGDHFKGVLGFFPLIVSSAQIYTFDISDFLIRERVNN